MKGWVLYNKLSQDLSENYSGSRFLEVAQRRGIELELHSPRYFELIVNNKDEKKSIWLNGKSCELPDFVIPRTGTDSGYFALALIRHLENLGIYVCNDSSTIGVVRDKWHVHQVLALNNIPTPKTMLLKFPIDIEFVKENIGFPLVIKNISGTEGNAISLCENPDQFKDIMDLMQSYNESMNIIIQEFVGYQKGEDLRVFVLGGRVIGCMKRIAKQGFKANYSLGARVEKYPVSPEIEWLATQTAHLLGLEIAGIDLLFDHNGFKVLEANSAPGFKGMEEVMGPCIAEEIFDYIMLKLTGKVG